MLQLHDEKIPLREADGVVYVGETRVTVDCVVEMFEHGASPEEIAEQYDTLALADVYAVLTYYLRNREAVRGFLTRRAAESEEDARSADAAFPSQLRQKLLRAKREKGERGGGG